MSSAAPALEVSDLRVEVDYGDREDIVDGITFRVDAGEVLGLVGESGSGKTTIGLAVLGHTRRGAHIARGEVRIEGRDILPLPALERQRLRGKLVSYVPQDPASALSPAMRIGKQLDEALSEHGFGSSDADRRARITEVLGEVLLPSDETFLKRYPHQLSGGQQQRVALAMAFANRPRVIVLDEPTTGLDVTTQAHVLETVRDLCALHGVAAVYVSHDLAVVATLATRVAVLYGGRLAEIGPTGTLFRLVGASLHATPRRGDSRALRQARARRHPRHRPEAGASPERLLLQAALPLRRREVRPGGPAARDRGRRARGSLLPLRRRPARRCGDPARGGADPGDRRESTRSSPSSGSTPRTATARCCTTSSS